MRDFNITRQIYLREFLINYNKLYIPINSDNSEEEWEDFLSVDGKGKSSEYVNYCYVIELLEDKTLTKDKFFKIYQKNYHLQQIGIEIIKKEESTKLFRDFDLDTKNKLLENTFSRLDILNFNDEYKQYDITENDFTSVISSLEKKHLIFSLEETSIDGTYDWHDNGLCNEMKNTFLHYDYVISNGGKCYLGNFYMALKYGLKFTIIVECIHQKSNKKRSRFIQSLFKEDSFSKNFNINDFGKLTTFKLIARNKNIILLCFIAHYLNLDKEDIIKLRKIFSISSERTVREKLTPLLKILFPNTTYLNN